MKRYKPTTPGRRGMTRVENSARSATKPLKRLTRSKKRISGRNNQGKLTVRHRGGGAKRRLRIIDFDRRDKIGITARVEEIEYDPNRTADIARIVYIDGERRYILASAGMEVGSTVVADEKVELINGNRTRLGSIPVGTQVYNIGIQPESKGMLARSAGSSAQVKAHEGGHTHLRMPSGEIRMILSGAWATIGSVSNSEHQFVNIGKAGRNRHLGKRPSVRGTAMSPPDHPHAGGEGRGGTKGPPKTPWGKHAYGVRTRKKKKYSNRLIIKRRIGKR